MNQNLSEMEIKHILCLLSVVPLASIDMSMPLFCPDIILCDTQLYMFIYVRTRVQLPRPMFGDLLHCFRCFFSIYSVLLRKKLLMLPNLEN